MSFCTILSALPSELLDKIFALLSSNRPVISACRLTCREFHILSSPYLITYVVLPTQFNALRKLHEIIIHPYFHRHVKQLVYVESKSEFDEEEKYETALEVASWEDLDEEDRQLWRVLGHYCTGRTGGPERLERIRPQLRSGYRHRYFVDYNEYVEEIQVTLLEKIPKCLPMLRSVLLVDYQTAKAASLLNDKLSNACQHSDYELSHTTQRRNLGLLIAAFNSHNISSLSIGSLSDWDGDCSPNLPAITVQAQGSASLDVRALDFECDIGPTEFEDIMLGLRKLQLSFVVCDKPLHKSVLPKLVQLAAPTLVCFGLEATSVGAKSPHLEGNKGLSVREGSDLTWFLNDLLLPRLVRLELRGWSYSQAQMESFLRRHAHTLHELVLIDNVLLDRNAGSFIEFTRAELSLFELKLLNSNLSQTVVESWG